jgi:hypothetical protein
VNRGWRRRLTAPPCGEGQNMTSAEALEQARAALIRLVAAVDALHASDDVVRELVRSHLNVELCLAVGAAVGVLDATAC